MVTSKGQRGERGARGSRGVKGAQGAKGERGPAGPGPTRAQVLRLVQAEFDEIRAELRVQLERMAQIQQQVDSIERILTRALSENGALTRSE